MVNVRPVAVFNMIDCGESDYKVIAVPVSDPRWEGVHDISDVNSHTIKELVHFFETYKSIEPGKVVKIEEVLGAKEAREAVARSIELYKEKFGS